MPIPDFDRPMSADQANFLLANIEKELKRRHEWDYNSKIKPKHKFNDNLNTINTVNTRYKPSKSTIDPENNVAPIGNPKVILDIHGMAIINSLLKVNSISTKLGKADKETITLTKRLIGGDIKPPLSINYGRVWSHAFNTPATNNLIQSLDDLFKIISGDINDDTVLNRVYSLFSDSEMKSKDVMNHIYITLRTFANDTPIHDVEDQEIGKYAEKNISLAFDYYVLTFLCMYLKIENDLYETLCNAINNYRDDTIGDPTRSTTHFMSNNSPLEPSSCRVVCAGLCTGSCFNTCNGCGGQCTRYCGGSCDTNCLGRCDVDCKSDCNLSCNTTCNGCKETCDGACSSDCTSSCGSSDCNSGCGTGCQGSCYMTNGGTDRTCGCGSQCSGDCGFDCGGGSNSVPLPVEPDTPVITPDPDPDPDKPETTGQGGYNTGATFYDPYGNTSIYFNPNDPAQVAIAESVANGEMTAQQAVQAIQNAANSQYGGGSNNGGSNGGDSAWYNRGNDPNGKPWYGNS